ncbi:ribonuclease H-like domain-containing protein [Tanacetum coccineum]
MTHPHPNRRFVPQAVLTRSGKINTAGASVNTAGARINTAVRPVNTAGSKPTVNHPRSISNTYKKGYSQVTRLFNTKKEQHMTGNKCYLTEYEDYDGYLFCPFGDGKGRISRKGFVESSKKDNITVVARRTLSRMVLSRRNRTLIEAARNMVLVIKPHNKTPYELIRRRTPLIDFMKPFGCPITILNTRDQLGKFDGKAEEIFFVGYSMVSKAMRVFNKRTRIVEETLNIRFLENAPNVTENRPDWLFNIDSLSKSMNYVTQLLQKTQTNDPKVSKEYAEEKTTEMDESGASDKDGEDDQAIRSEFERLLQQEKQTLMLLKLLMHLRNIYLNNFLLSKMHYTLTPVSNVTPMNDTRIFGKAYDDEDVGAEADLNNLETTMNVSPIPITRIDKDHLKYHIIGDLNSPFKQRMD